MSYKFSVSATEHFARQIKYLAKKYPSVKADLAKLIALLAEDPFMGDPVGKNCYKIRLKITSKNTGKSGGARVITFVKISVYKVVLIDIFDKSDKENISDSYLKEILKKIKDQIV
ncbi:MAG TPA: hypothetical protein VI548_14585 [Chitinophagaceae bacterium]|nr:hypothetical protein [Chitinophagaceae bacterium]